MLKANRSFLILFFYFLIASFNAFPQGFNPYKVGGQPDIKRSPIRAVLNKFSLIVAPGGYGRTFYSNPIESGNVIEYNNNVYLLDNYWMDRDSIRFSGLGSWMTNPTIVRKALAPDEEHRILYSDSLDLFYRGSGYNIPLTAILHFDFSRFRIGGGITYEWHRFNTMGPKGYDGVHYNFPFKTSYFKYFATFGGKVYRYRGWDYYLDLRVGMHNYKSDYTNLSAYKRIYFNVGVPMEFELSEYFFIYVRPSFDFKGYTINMPTPEGAGQYPSSFQVNQPTFSVQVGVRLKYPEVPRCPVKSCRTQLKHVHDGYEFRGQPFQKEQNPKIGELYPKYHRDKWRNRRKLGGGY